MTEEQDNGKKTEAQLAEERLARYKADPNTFIETKPEIIVCVIRSPRGPMLYMGGNEQELQIAYAKINQKVMNMLNAIDKARAPKIVTPGFLQGLRNMKK